jgi:shikimate dehydrogenase
VKPRRFAVIGDPVAHSKSPAMHAAAFRALDLPHSYEAVRVTAAELPRVVQALREGSYDGLNVTVPHKEAVLALVDDVAVTGMAAANTLVRREDGRLVAHNTDVPALAEELRLLAGPLAAWSSRRALVLGSGGAALAAVAALRSLGAVDVAVRSRRPRAATTQPWGPSPESEARSLAVVQATSGGMTGADPGDAIADVVAWGALPGDAVALDAVYAPPETPFLRAARARGLRCSNGLGMLARQGALAFELWLDLPAPFDVMRAALDR